MKPSHDGGDDNKERNNGGGSQERVQKIEEKIRVDRAEEFGGGNSANGYNQQAGPINNR